MHVMQLLAIIDDQLIMFLQRGQNVLNEVLGDVSGPRCHGVQEVVQVDLRDDYVEDEHEPEGEDKGGHEPGHVAGL